MGSRRRAPRGVGEGIAGDDHKVIGKLPRIVKFDETLDVRVPGFADRRERADGNSGDKNERECPEPDHDDSLVILTKNPVNGGGTERVIAEIRGTDSAPYHSMGRDGATVTLPES